MLCCFDGGFRKQVGFKICKAVFQFATVRRFAHFNKKKTMLSITELKSFSTHKLMRGVSPQNYSCVTSVFPSQNRTHLIT